MASVTLKGNPVAVGGKFLAAGDAAPAFQLADAKRNLVGLDAYAGKRKVLNIFPSIDTPTCATSVRTFNKEASSVNNTVVLCVSADLPFAQSRFCGTEGISNAITVSDFATGKFGKDYQLEITTGPLAALHSRSVVVLDQNHTVVYTQQVPEIVDEPDYEAALASLK